MESSHHNRKTSIERCKRIHAGCEADLFLVSPGPLACAPLPEHLIQLFVSAQRQKHLYTLACSIFVIVCSCKCSYLSCQLTIEKERKRKIQKGETTADLCFITEGSSLSFCSVENRVNDHCPCEMRGFVENWKITR